MIIPIELRFKADKDSKSAFRTEKTIKSHDVNSIEFHISIDGLELTDNHTAKILSIFHSSKSQVNVDCEIVEGGIIYKPDTKLISRHEHVTNYVYVYNNNQSLDVCEFTYIVDLSKIDGTSLEVKEVYDQSYADLLADFEQALEDYKLTLPQADSLRADIDEILNQFSVDSQAKLSLINEVESSRVQAEGQRESAEADRVSAESSRVSAESERVQAENERENAEAQRKTDHANRSAEIAGKADKVVLKNLVENGDFSDGLTGWSARSVLANSSGITEDLDTNDHVTAPNSVKWTLDNSNLRYRWDINNGSAGDMFYARVSTKKDTLLHITFYELATHNNITSYISIPNSNQWISSSIIGESTSNGISLGLFNGTGVTGTVNFDNLMVINLTQTFGAGNEPIKEEMDELIKVTGYIDGEYALNNKEMLIWTLALIRRNKNATVALGGA